MPTTIRIKRTATPDRAPVDLAEGELAVEMASNPLRLWVGVPESIDASGRRLLAGGGGVTGDYLPLIGGTLYQPDTATELRVQADNGLDAGIFFLTTDVDEWWVGTYGTGDFCIYDMADAAGGERLRIDEGGTVGIPGRLSVGDLAWFGDQLHVTAGAWLNGGATTNLLAVTSSATIADLRVTGTGIVYPDLGPNLNRVGFTWTGAELRSFVDGLDQGAVLTNGFNGAVQFNQNLNVAGNIFPWGIATGGGVEIGDGLNVASTVSAHDLIARGALWQGSATPIGNAISAVNLHAQNELHVQGPAWLNAGLSTSQIDASGNIFCWGIATSGGVEIGDGLTVRGVLGVGAEAVFHNGGRALWWQVDGALTVHGGATISGTTTTNRLHVNGTSDIGLSIQAQSGVAARIQMDSPGRTWFLGVHPETFFRITDNAGGAQIWRLQIDTAGITQLNGGLLVHGAAEFGNNLVIHQQLHNHNGAWFNAGLNVTAGLASKPGGGVWADWSDARLKKDIEAYTRGLDAICQLRPVTYRFNGLAGSRDDGSTYHGLIAQETLDIMPEMVGEDPFRGGYMMDCTALTYALVNAARELADKNAALEARVTALEERG